MNSQRDADGSHFEIQFLPSTIRFGVHYHIRTCSDTLKIITYTNMRELKQLTTMDAYQAGATTTITKAMMTAAQTQ